MKFKKGDVVKYPPEQFLTPSFVGKWGRGPFVVRSIISRSRLLLQTMDGAPLTGGTMSGGLWRHDPSALVLDPFLDAARKAVADANT